MNPRATWTRIPLAQVLDLIDELGQDLASFIVVTHDPAIAAHMNRTLELRDGMLQELK